MSLACELTLHKMDDGYRLFRKPTEAFGKLKIGDGQKIESACNEAAFDLPMPAETDIVIDTEDQCQVTVCGAGFTYSPADRMLYFTSGKQFRLHGTGALSCRIVTDVRSVEFFIDDEISATYFIYEDGATTKKLNISGKDVKVSGKIFDLESIWK